MDESKVAAKEKPSLISKWFGNIDLIEGVRWSEKYSDTFERAWNKVPNVFGHVIATLVIFILGTTLRGEWILILVHFLKQMSGLEEKNSTDNTIAIDWSNLSAETFKLQNGLTFMVMSIVVSFAVYFGAGGFVHWYFYVRQRDRAHEWKIQPEKFMTPELHRNAVALGSFSLFLTSALGGLLACYVINGGPSAIYYKYNDFGWTWFFLQFPVYFVYADYVTYLMHRTYHTKWLYKHIHKLHHAYKQPTVFTVTAIHPVEIITVQMSMLLPIFFVPLHWIPVYAVAVYNYYHGILDHSGIDFKSHWWQPWQPDAVFHDNHHQYFHVNYGFNCAAWDKLHGTLRQADRIYTEDTYYGGGKKISEATEAEINFDLEERMSENPKAYRSDEHATQIKTISDLKHKTK